jgi:flagellar basal body rod protein FlgG
MTLPPITQSIVPPAPQRPEPPRAMFSALAIASSGLSAQRVRMDVIAQNLANAETTKTPQGGPYQRRVVTLEAVAPQTMNTTMTMTPDAATAAPSRRGGLWLDAHRDDERRRRRAGRVDRRRQE